MVRVKSSPAWPSEPIHMVLFLELPSPITTFPIEALTPIYLSNGGLRI